MFSKKKENEDEERRMKNKNKTLDNEVNNMKGKG